MPPLQEPSTDTVQATITSLLAGTALPQLSLQHQTALAHYLAAYHGATLEGPASVDSLQALVRAWAMMRLEARRLAGTAQGGHHA